MPPKLICLLIAVLSAVVTSDPSVTNNETKDEPSKLTSVFHEYCVIGAGPSGLQMGFFLKRADRDYIIFEKSNTPGNFYTKYPRHRTLISINKRNTGKTNKEFNWRHDWNSLLSDDDSLEMRHYSKKMFPHADKIVDYLRDYHSKLGLKVQFDTTISGIVKLTDPSTDEYVFTMKDQRGQTYLCQTLLVASGAATPIILEFPGSENAIGYEDIPIDGESFEGQSVLILGRGNAAFETADAIYGNTNFIYMVARSRARLSWSTHYVGDIRGVNNGLLDTYQLKSLDGLAELDVRAINITKTPDGRLAISPSSDGKYRHLSIIGDNYPFRDHFDSVIRCLGFKFDDSIFGVSPAANVSSYSYLSASNPGKMTGRRNKYPNVTPDHQAVNVTGLYFIGVISHGIDWRESAGGFIHGFRYTTRTVHRLLEKRNHGVAWPHETYPITEIVPTIIKRINEASGTYQMFYVLGDVYAISSDGESFEVYEEFPVKMIEKFAEMTGCNHTRLIVNLMEYGREFSYPGSDVFSTGRAVGDPQVAHRSNFLHPVFYYYPELPTAEQVKNKSDDKMPEAKMVHHIVEDFTTFWDGQYTHISPLRRFIDNVLGIDLRRFRAEDCFRWIMTHGSEEDKMPSQCRSYASQPGAAFNLASEAASADSPWTLKAPLAPLFNIGSL